VIEVVSSINEKTVYATIPFVRLGGACTRSTAIDFDARFGGAIFNRHKKKTILLFVESIFHF
jgi:hypothetical protein